MPLECERHTGQLSRNSSASAANLTSGNDIKQISALFSGSTKDVRDSNVILDYGGGNQSVFPTPRQLRRVHGGTTESSQINLSTYNDVSYLYGYYIDCSFELNNNVDIIMDNGDPHNSTKYECVALIQS
jgi:hypothetical protein